MSERRESARKEVERLIAQFNELASKAGEITQKMTELAKEIERLESIAGKSSHELEIPPDAE